MHRFERGDAPSSDRVLSCCQTRLRSIPLVRRGPLGNNCPGHGAATQSERDRFIFVSSCNGSSELAAEVEGSEASLLFAQALKRELDGVSPGLDLAGMHSASIGTGAAANGANGNGAHPGGCGSCGPKPSP